MRNIQINMSLEGFEYGSKFIFILLRHASFSSLLYPNL